jgi:hypothetical protein
LNIFIFTGPTISAQEAQEYCKAQYLPPAAQGDIIRLLRKEPEVIGIIDGYFNSVPSVWHKEILLALSRGVRVVGGASMGALRAAELDAFGMVGIGKIYQAYRQGSLEADDEVAVVHAGKDFNYRPLSEAMVNIRATLKSALKAHVINQETFQNLIDSAKGMYYRERTYRQLIKKGRENGIPKVECESLETFLGDQKIDLKKEDAIKVLEYIEAISEDGQLKIPEFELQHTQFLQDLLDREQMIFLTEDEYITYEELVNHARLEWDDFFDIVERSVSDLLILSLANQQGITLSEEEIKEGADKFMAQFGAAPDQPLQWAEHNDLNDCEFEQLVKDWLLIQKMRSQEFGPDSRILNWDQIKDGQNEELVNETVEALKYRFGNRDIVRQLKIEGRYEDLLREALETQIKARAADEHIYESINLDKLVSFYIDKMQLKEGMNVFTHAEQMGFETQPGFMLALLKMYLSYSLNE